MRTFVALALALASARGDTTTLVTFDDATGTSYDWVYMNDPVMGGASTSTFETENGAGVFNGTCAIVDSLDAPGFCKAYTYHTLVPTEFADVSAHIDGALLIKLRTTTPSYTGYKVAFSATGIPIIPGSHTAYGTFKADFMAADTTDVQLVTVPFNTFSYDWSPYTVSVPRRRGPVLRPPRKTSLPPPCNACSRPFLSIPEAAAPSPPRPFCATPASPSPPPAPTDHLRTGRMRHLGPDWRPAPLLLFGHGLHVLPYRGVSRADHGL